MGTFSWVGACTCYHLLKRAGSAHTLPFSWNDEANCLWFLIGCLGMECSHSLTLLPAYKPKPPVQAESHLLIGVMLSRLLLGKKCELLCVKTCFPYRFSIDGKTQICKYCSSTQPHLLLKPFTYQVFQLAPQCHIQKPPINLPRSYAGVKTFILIQNIR